MNRAEEILKDLIAIPSVNPRGGTADGGETKVAQYVLEWASRKGWEGQLDTVETGRENVTVTVPGNNPGTILLQTHIDTVEVDGMIVDPYMMMPRTGNQRHVTGRGVCDAKGQLAMFMAALERLAQTGQPHHSVILAACVDEEEHFKGVLELCARLSPPEITCAVVGEPTELRLVNCHKGVLRGRIFARGPGGHSSGPFGITNPIETASEIILHLTADALRLREMDDPLVGPPTFTFTLINGGEAINMIPREIILQYDRRTLPHEDPIQVWEHLRADLEGRWPGVHVEEPLLADMGLPASRAPFLDIFMQILESNALEHDPIGVSYGSDASKIARLGIPAIVFGAGSIKQAHTTDEYLDLDQLDIGVQVIHDLISSLIPKDLND